MITPPADYTVETYRSFAWSGLSCPHFTTPWHRAGIYLLLCGTTERASRYAGNVNDDDAFDLLASLPIDDLDVACHEQNARFGHDRPGPISGAFTISRVPRARRVRVDRSKPRLPLRAVEHRHGGPQRAASCAPPDGRVVHSPAVREHDRARDLLACAKRAIRRSHEAGLASRLALWRGQAVRLLRNALRARSRRWSQRAGPLLQLEPWSKPNAWSKRRPLGQTTRSVVCSTPARNDAGSVIV